MPGGQIDNFDSNTLRVNGSYSNSLQRSCPLLKGSANGAYSHSRSAPGHLNATVGEPLRLPALAGRQLDILDWGSLSALLIRESAVSCLGLDWNASRSTPLVHLGRADPAQWNSDASGS